MEELIGEIGIVRRALDPEGIVFVHGELWRARSTDGPVALGEQVRVERVGDDLGLDVAPARTPVPTA